MSLTNIHIPILAREFVGAIFSKPNGVYLDCTGGGGGHAQLLLNQLNADGRLYVCERHTKTCQQLKQKFYADHRVTVICQRFSLVFDNLNLFFDGIMADLGVSTMQLFDEQLGIGFNLNEAPLDMRFDAELEFSAAEILATYSQPQLADCFFNLGGERASRRIARAIVADREKNIFYTNTKELKELCERVLGKFYYKAKIHPATKVFQALRIEVNQELAEIDSLLRLAPLFMHPKGVLAILSFHAGEDSLVKKKFRELDKNGFYLPQRKAIKPSVTEIALNPSSRSAKMRVLIKESL